MRGLGLFFVVGCAGGGAAPDSTGSVTSSPTATDGATTDPPSTVAPSAHVTAVDATGSAGAYEVSVTLRSADTGCAQYADWWEVVSPERGLVYRRILTHSHVDDQPFTRSGGPVDIAADELVYVRGHMNPQGYVGDVFGGTVAGGFARVETPEGLSSDLEQADPQPDGCLF